MDLFFRITGGRPMTREGLAFVDTVSGKSVEYRRDKFGRLWLADGGAWSWFRVPLTTTTAASRSPQSYKEKK